MLLKADQDRVTTLLKDTITLLCKNGLPFNDKFSIDAVIGVTVDENDAFYLSINKIVRSDKVPVEKAEKSCNEELMFQQDVEPRNQSQGSRNRKRKRKPEKIKPVEYISDDDDLQEVRPFFPTRNAPIEIAPSPKSMKFSEKTEQHINRSTLFVKQELHDSWDTFTGQESTPAPNKITTAPKSMKSSETTEQHVNRSTIFVKQELDNSYDAFTGQESTPIDNQESPQPQNIYQNTAQFRVFNGGLLTGISPIAESSAHWSQDDTPTDSPQDRDCFPDLLGDNSAPFHNAQSSNDETTATTSSYVVRTYTNTNALRKSSTVRGDDIVYTCQICGRTFVSHSGYMIHMDQHNGIFPYNCKECGKGFTAKTSLNGHMRHHTGERLSCEECGKEFIFKLSLRNHMKSLHGIVNWSENVKHSQKKTTSPIDSPAGGPSQPNSSLILTDLALSGDLSLTPDLSLLNPPTPGKDPPTEHILQSDHEDINTDLFSKPEHYLDCE